VPELREIEPIPVRKGEEKMIEFRVVTLASLVVIFTSVFFVHFVFNNYVTTMENCSIYEGAGCTEISLSHLFVFSFFVVVAFIILIETTIYFMFRQVELEMKYNFMGDKKTGESLQGLEDRLEELKKAKKEAQKKYLNREMGSDALRSMERKYNKEITELEVRITEMKKKASKGWF
jgi:hypothetical protein